MIRTSGPRVVEAEAAVGALVPELPVEALVYAEASKLLAPQPPEVGAAPWAHELRAENDHHHQPERDTAHGPELVMCCSCGVRVSPRKKQKRGYGRHYCDPGCALVEAPEVLADRHAGRSYMFSVGGA